MYVCVSQENSADAEFRCIQGSLGPNATAKQAQLNEEKQEIHDSSV